MDIHSEFPPTVPETYNALSLSRLREVLEYDPVNGDFNWRIPRPGTRKGTPAGTLTKGYLAIEIDRRFYRASRLAWAFLTGAFPPKNMLVDHINGVRNDNRAENLRLATYAENSRNRRACPRNTSGKVGVHPLRNGYWGAEIGVDGKAIKLGRFECIEEAISVRCRAEKHWFGAFRAKALPLSSERAGGDAGEVAHGEAP